MTVFMGLLFLLSVSEVSLEDSSQESPSPAIIRDFAELFRRGMKPDEVLRRIKQIADKNCVPDNQITMTHERHFLANASVTCNDGTPAGFYIKKAYGSTRWLVFLEGGGYCFDQASCRGRWINSPYLMSSSNWPLRRKGTGIWSSDPEENPYLYNANLVFLPYCSSDTWSGTYQLKSKETKGEYSFMGSIIVEEVIKQLAESHGLRSATRLILAGSSAGGLGVLLNLDHVAELMGHVAPYVDVRGIADSGWFLDNLQYKKTACTAAHTCAPSEGIQRGIQFWHGRVPASCKAAQPNDYWRCYFGYRLYSTLKTPVFIVQHLFDEAQIKADNVGPPVKREQWQYIHNMGKDMKRTLHNVSAVFAPACLSHILLTRSEWQKVKINGVSLPEALECWENGHIEPNSHSTQRRFRSRQQIHRLITGVDSERTDANILKDDPDYKTQEKMKKERRKYKKTRRRRTKRKRHKGRDRSRDHNLDNTHERERRQRQRRALMFFDQHDRHHMSFHNNKCFHHQLDHCAWPQCNLACPKIHNPFTGEEMDFIDLLLQFGLDLSSIANALGMDLSTLQSMDHDLLLKKLTQQS